MANEKLIAPKYKRLAAFLVDFILILLLWYLMTMKDLKRVDTLLESLDPLTEGALDRLAESIFKMATAFLLKWLLVRNRTPPAQPAGCGKLGGNVAESVGPAGICGKNAVRDALDTSRDRQLVHAPAVERREKPA